MLRWRLLLGTLFIALLVGLCWLDHRASLPGVWLAPLLAIVCLLATGEVLALLERGGTRPPAVAAYAGNLVVLASNWFAIAEGSSPALEGPALALALASIALGLVEMRRFRGPGGVTGNLAGGFFALVYVGFLASFAVQLRLRWGVAALASLLVVTKMGDIGAYAVGRLIGRHKMAPRISPGKTLEGAAGALVFSLTGAWLSQRWLVAADGDPAVAWGWIVYGIVVGLAGMFGDLAESLLKRDAGVKDSSVWLPGFGGVLDLLDSILWAGPAAYACWAFGLVG